MSDYSPVLLDEGGVRRGFTHFGSENMWLKEEGFLDLVKQWWTRFRFRGFFSFILVEKLKILKCNLKRWNREVFDNVAIRKNLVISQVGFEYAKETLKGLSVEEVLLGRSQGLNFVNGLLWRKLVGGRSLGRCG